MITPECAALTVEGHTECRGVAIDVDGQCKCPCHITWIWLAKMDGRFACRVLRVSAYRGHLFLTDMLTGKTLIDKEVRLSHGARLGPDADDQEKWMRECLRAVDDR